MFWNYLERAGQKKAVPGNGLGRVFKSAGPGFAPSRSRGLEIDRRGLAVALVGLELVGDLLTLAQAHQARALHRRDVDEDILAAVVRLDEAVALRLVEPLHRTRFHGLSSSVYARGRPARRDPPGSSSFWKGSPERALRAAPKAKRPSRPAQMSIARQIGGWGARCKRRCNPSPERRPLRDATKAL